MALEEIEKLKNEISNTKNFTHQKNDDFMNRLYILKLQSINTNDNSDYKVLQHLENYIDYQNSKLNNFKNSLLTLISTIFLPLSFIVGFFGMNFASMGNPGIKDGILAIDNSL